MATDARQASDQQQNRLRGIAQNDQDAASDILRIEVQASGVDDRTYALTNFAALITTGIPDPANYVLHVTRCLDAGCSADEVIGTMVAITPNVGMVKMVAAAPFVAAALDIDVGTGDGGQRGDRFAREGSGAGAGTGAGAGAGAGAGTSGGGSGASGGS
jgi:alkylhydroperoxidase/carboxymuconolactone decarboxylase family protein YurZ